jgi:tetratricopeptide (TPR) repeat protein
MNDKEKKCPRCQDSIKDSTQFCPSCGRELSRSKKNRGLSDFLILGAVIIIAATVFWGVKAGNYQPSPVFEHPDITGMPADPEQINRTMPDNYDELVQLGNDFMDRRQFRIAIEYYSRAREKKSDDPNMIVDLGTCYHALGEYDRAIENFNTALKLDPEHEIAHLNLGVAYYSLGQYDMTRQYWGMLLEISPDKPIADTVRKYLDQLPGSEGGD